MDIAEILAGWLAGQTPQMTDYEKLLAAAQQHPEQAAGLDCELSVAGIAARAKEFVAIAPKIIQLSKSMQYTNEPAILRTLWELWLPLAAQLRAARQQQDQPLIQGILGGQGTGKTTISRMLQGILHHWNYPCISISIDDLYKTYAERQKLLETQPRLIWRGPPGTHDIDTGLEVLMQLQRANIDDKIAIPRFDKSLHQGQGDRVDPENVEPAEIILFEGWFVGCRPADPQVFEQPPTPIDTSEDKQFAREMNEALQAYLPLWEKLDRLMVLYPEDYRLSKQWRKDAEHNMMAQGKSGMDDAEIDDFVDYFWRSLHPELFITPLTKNSAWTDLVIEIDAEHRPCAIYRPTTDK
ncbi:glycerate kinase [[Leptolyngbya] sp. PCC 7376]|uniref:glycerate kinase n=1 Tax=[Leptolyngbya] sp. PCC 7376 TaxID=111781 RepID=UPI00029F4245|nr:glycerate kinase [[Leptolyngbya] sp. PCC 7376]AFY37327.1 glycerate kinase [[Leptolyngbya] sp. PCC 7376]